MKKRLLLVSLCVASINIACGSLDTAKIEKITGLKGKFNEKEGAYKVTFPRADVQVVVDGWTMPPFMGLGSHQSNPWAGRETGGVVFHSWRGVSA
jgi:hypothetical protein